MKSFMAYILIALFCVGSCGRPIECEEKVSIKSNNKSDNVANLNKREKLEKLKSELEKNNANFGMDKLPYMLDAFEISDAGLTEMLIENITKLGKKALPYVARKIEECKSNNKKEILHKIIIAIQNEVILWQVCPNEYETVKFDLWGLQLLLEEYYKKYKTYPMNLEKVAKSFPSQTEQLQYPDPWNNHYKYTSVENTAIE